MDECSYLAEIIRSVAFRMGDSCGVFEWVHFLRIAGVCKEFPFFFLLFFLVKELNWIGVLT